jgi:hypothetical protein
LSFYWVLIYQGASGAKNASGSGTLFVVIFLMKTAVRVVTERKYILLFLKKTQSQVLTKFSENFVSVKMFALRKIASKN